MITTHKSFARTVSPSVAVPSVESSRGILYNWAASSSIRWATSKGPAQPRARERPSLVVQATLERLSAPPRHRGDGMGGREPPGSNVVTICCTAPPTSWSWWMTCWWSACAAVGCSSSTQRPAPSTRRVAHDVGGALCEVCSSAKSPGLVGYRQAAHSFTRMRRKISSKAGPSCPRKTSWMQPRRWPRMQFISASAIRSATTLTAWQRTQETSRSRSGHPPDGARRPRPTSMPSDAATPGRSGESPERPRADTGMAQWVPRE